jgi:hypothetical protein
VKDKSVNRGRDGCEHCGRDGRTRDLARGEQMSMDRLISIHGRLRFNFPTSLRAFISSRDECNAHFGVLSFCNL